MVYLKDKKYCPRCREDKLLESFAKNRSRKYGLQSTCRKCFNSIYGKRDPQKRREQHIKRYYNLTWEIYENWYELQKGKCGICGCDIKKIGDKNIKSGAHVDHDHTNNEFRALLCHDCNAGLGYFKDNIDILKMAQEYLEVFKHKGVGK